MLKERVGAPRLIRALVLAVVLVLVLVLALVLVAVGISAAVLWVRRALAAGAYLTT